MAKEILMSIQPKWCAKIANGEKTIEVRKSRPKLETPFKCYIYCTIGNGVKGDYLVPSGIQCGKVIGEFVCKGIMQPFDSLRLMAKQSCLTENELFDYSKGKTLYGWRISDLKIYDKPKELSEFRTICRDVYCQDDYGTPTWFCKDGYGACAVKDKEKEYPYNEECIYFDCPSYGDSGEYEDYAYCNCNGLKPITRPPQSWCYVE